MIPVLPPDRHLPEVYRRYLDALGAGGFEGEVAVDYAARLVTATDNSVYQMLPVAVVFPKSQADVVRLLATAHQPEFRDVKLSPRGGGTGTNGQSLSDGVMVDVSRHMNRILELDLQAGFVRVEPGVVLDELNAYLAPHGVFFAPNLSPSNRATLGGMISTDASGKGSRVYGKTSQHVLELRAVLSDGSLLESRPVTRDELERLRARQDLVGHVYRTVDDVVSEHGEKIRTALPKLQRFVTGYDLLHVQRDDGSFDLNSVLSGSEGTLALLTQAKLKLTPLPKHRTLLAIRYPDFDAALRAARTLVEANPGAIETVDGTILELARGDTIWHSVHHLIEAPDEPRTEALNLVEFESDDARAVAAKVAELAHQLDAARGEQGQASGYTIARDKRDIAALWALRKKGVGLLGNVQGERRPVPFVEDTAVPPERLADYIRDFRALLDQHGLRYGMFGHIDVGCLHVRPALNLRDPEDERLLHEISDQVAALVKRYGGVLWGEHGKGIRGQYSPLFFGPELYAELRRVKAAFDPYNQLNPGKLATPLGSSAELIGIDAVKRGKFDRQITPALRQTYDLAVHCNGNAACFDWNPHSVMCPSSKVTRDRIHSPKGRAGILREWLRLLSQAGGPARAGAASAADLVERQFRPRHAAPDDFSHEVYDAMNGCLACKACATQCPVKVDVPALRSEFLELYHTRYPRPLKDYFVAMLELVLGVVGVFPSLVNRFFRAAWFQRFLSRVVGIVDSPLLAEQTLAAGLRARGAPRYEPSVLGALAAEEKARTVLVAQDIFTTYYEPNVALATYDVLTKLGYRVVFLPLLENGKALHIKGFLGRFRRVAARAASFYSEVAALGLPILGLEPAVTLTYRDEYPRALGTGAVPFKIELVQEFLVGQLHELGKRPELIQDEPLRFELFGHCTERTAEPAALEQWQQVFAVFGLDLGITGSGCCGMCGVFGHEREHYAESRGVYELSWGPKLARADRASVVVDGHSCRSQVKRFGGFLARHPMEALRDVICDSAAR